MMNYKILAQYYDELLSDNEVLKEWILSFVKEIKGPKVLDMACGSGNAITILNELNYDAQGFDLSEDMINLAIKKNPNNIFKIMDMRDFHYDEKFDGVICLMDSLNYINKINDLKQVFINVYECLNYDGVLMFDYHNISRLKEFEEPYIEEGRLLDADYEWTINSDGNYLLEQFVFWVNNKSVVENHYQYIFEIDDVKKVMQEVGFDVIVKNINEEKYMIWGYKK